MADLVLKVDGKVYGGWQEITVQRGIRRLADTFAVKLTERWAGQETIRPIKPDSPCKVAINDETIITGFVDDVAVNYDAKNHEINVNGRSLLGDLVDCSGNQKSWNVSMKLEQMAKFVCDKFGVKVIVETDTGQPFKSQVLESGETYFEFLSRLADFRAVHLTSNSQGNLIITRAGKERIGTALVLGENVLSATGNNSKRERFYHYTVLGQDKGGDWGSGATTSQIKGEAFDKKIRKTRTTYIEPGDKTTLNDVKRIAEYERNIRYGESQTITYTVNGWHHKDGLWQHNKLVPIVDLWLQIDEDRLITHVTYIMDDKGQRTELEIMPPEALDKIPLPENKEGEETWAIPKNGAS